MAQRLHFLATINIERNPTNTSQKERKMSRVCNCPRCGDRSFEKLKTYSHCSSCFYTEDSWVTNETFYFKAMQDQAEINDSILKIENQKNRKGEENECS